MPELPEVETTRQELIPYVIDRKITGVDLFWDGMVRQPDPDSFRKGIIGRQIIGVGRRGKYLIFELDNGQRLIIHMKMSGSLLLERNDGRFIRAIIHLDKGDIYFRDPRKFGRMWLVSDVNEVVGGLGPEPLDTTFTVKTLVERLNSRKAPVKAVLTDQSVVAGVGNMYADEALFQARLHPLRPVNSLSSEEIKRLYDAIRSVLQEGISDKGASIENYVRPSGEPGSAHYRFKVAHQRKADCPVCGGPVKRIAVRHRGTYFCPKCQHIAEDVVKTEEGRATAPTA